MSELNKHNNYQFNPALYDENGDKIYRCKLSEKEKMEYDASMRRKIKKDKRRHMILTAESELIRIIKHLSSRNEIIKNRDYIPDILSLKVGKSFESYKANMKESKCELVYRGITYKRIMVSSSNSRTQKAMFVTKELWDKSLDILLCGIDRNVKYRYISKWNSYIGLAATDSIPVTMPKIVVIDDKEIWQKAKFDVVKEIDTRNIDGKVNRKFSVLHNKVKRYRVNLFDGAGLVTVKKATEWSKELNLKYIPASFQFRCIPCLKGKLYTMPIEEFAKEYKVSKIIDINGREWDLFHDDIDCILTKSQFKFYDLYSSIMDWENEQKKKIYGYCRTFNISEYDVDYSELSDIAVMAYQPLQTLQFDDKEIKQLCSNTIETYANACTSVSEFLKYRGILDGEDEQDINWSKYPPYYQAMYYNHSLYHDSFIQRKIKQDLKSSRERAYVGKIRITGNYQTFTPDLYALMQHTFGLPVTGLLKGNEVYSNYWNHHLVESPWIDIIRSPHISKEHCPAMVVTSGVMERWFFYQKTGIIVSVFGNTIALKLNSADFDGDHVLTTDNRIICRAAREQFANTVYHEKIEYPYIADKKAEKIVVSDMNTILECDYRGYRNNIGDVINSISVLWSLEQSKEIKDSIKIMSVVGSITIDYAKHGEEAEIPEKIYNLIKNHKKPYFMKYLRSYRKKRSREKEAKSVAVLLNNDYESQFEDSDCTMNRICHHIEENIGKINLHTDVPEEFDIKSLFANIPDVTSHKYKRIRDCLVLLQEEFYDISNNNYYDYDFSVSNQIEKDNHYQCLYDYAKSELLEIEKNISNLLDILLSIYYTDKKFMKKYQDKSILWNCFGETLVQRVKGECENTVSEEDFNKIMVRKEKAEKQLNGLLEYREKNFIIKEFESQENKERPVNIYKEDISWIKKQLPTKLDYSTECRKLLLAIIYICRKCNAREITLCQNQNNRLNRTVICKLVKINKNNLHIALKTLSDKGMIKMEINSKGHLRLEVLRLIEPGQQVLKESVNYQKLYAIANDRFREKTKKIVKNDCA